MNIRSRLWIIALAICFSATLVFAQQEQPESEVVLLIQNSVLVPVTADAQATIGRQNELGGVQANAIRSAGAEAWYITNAEVDPQAQNIYFIEASGSDERGNPTATRLIKQNMLTGARTSLSERSGMFSFKLSPDQRYIALIYYSGDYNWSVQQACSLNLQTLECAEVGLQSLDRTAYWVDNDRFLLLHADMNPIVIVDATTGNHRRISLPPEWYVNSASPIPSNNSLLVSAVPREKPYDPPQFFRFDLGTDTLTNTGIQNQPIQYTVSAWRFSPSGQYVLYTSSTNVLIEYPSGRVIREFENIYVADWLDNDTLIIQQLIDQQTMTISRFDIASASLTLLASGDAANGILLVP